MVPEERVLRTRVPNRGCFLHGYEIGVVAYTGTKAGFVLTLAREPWSSRRTRHPPDGPDTPDVLGVQNYADNNNKNTIHTTQVLPARSRT
jgi:hypothetical protein